MRSASICILKQVKKFIVIKLFVPLLTATAKIFGFGQSADPYPEHIRKRFTQKIDRVDIAKVAKLPRLNSLARFISRKRSNALKKDQRD